MKYLLLTRAEDTSIKGVRSSYETNEIIGTCKEGDYKLPLPKYSKLGKKCLPLPHAQEDTIRGRGNGRGKGGHNIHTRGSGGGSRVTVVPWG